MKFQFRSTSTVNPVVGLDTGDKNERDRVLTLKTFQLIFKFEIGCIALYFEKVPAS